MFNSYPLNNFDPDLLRKADETAWKDFFHSESPKVVANLERQGYSTEIAEEATQMAFIKAFREASQLFTSPLPVRGWLIVAATNYALSISRSEGRGSTWTLTDSSFRTMQVPDQVRSTLVRVLTALQGIVCSYDHLRKLIKAALESQGLAREYQQYGLEVLRAAVQVTHGVSLNAPSTSSDGTLAETIPACSPCPDGINGEAELRLRLSELCVEGKIAPEDRKVFELIYFSEKTMAEAAEELGKTMEECEAALARVRRTILFS